MRLEEVKIRENGLHGVLINDQAEYFNDPASVSEAGSAARLLVEVSDSRFERNGFNLIAEIVDAVSLDNPIGGILVREDAGGDLSAELADAVARRNTGDGIKLDENGAGDLAGRIRRTTASDNQGAGVALEQALPGSGAVQVRSPTANGKGGGAVVNDAGVVVTGFP